MKFFIGVFTLVVAGFLVMQEAGSQNAPKQQVGPIGQGGFLLNNGWTIRPTGKQVPVDTFPMSMAVSNNGKYLLVLNGGYNPPSVSIIDMAQQKEVGRTPLPDAWLGLTVAPQGNLVYVGGATKAVVYELSLDSSTGALKQTREIAAVSDVNNKGLSFIGDVTLSADGRFLYAADVHTDFISVINVQTGRLIGRWKSGRRPYRLLLAPNGKSLFVSSWADASIYQYDIATSKEISRIRVGPHPTDMLWLNKPVSSDDGDTNYTARLFVTASNTNYVYSFGVTADTKLKQLETINVSMTPLNPLGMTPSALSVDKDGRRLYIVCSDANAVAVADISGIRTRVLGFVPAGWYPTDVRTFDDGQLVILNGKGLGSKPNPDGPNPTKRAAPLYEGGPAIPPGYVAHMQTGTVAFVPAFTDRQLGEFTDTALDNSPYRDEMIYNRTPGPQEAYFSSTQGHPSPIRHVIYIIKENRTYDQVLGDLEKGNGDKSLTLFGEQVTPNLHQLAREFVLYDNFYENADVSAEGHNWASAAIAPDYTVKMWPNSYAGRRKAYDYEGGEPANTPPAGYIWNNALQAGITIRNYGQWAENIPLASAKGPVQIQKLRDLSLVPYTDMNYRAFDLEYPDVDRAKEFIREWKDFDAKRQAPQFLIVRMGNDHTLGTKAGGLTPLSYNADNDYAVGLLVDAVSHSKLWASTAIFIIEDDSQNGPDHVDSHRAPAWVISPFTHRGLVDSTMYNQAGILHTMELILGLRPMTQFDAAATPLFAGFSQTGDTRAYTAIPPKISLTDRNAAQGSGSVASARMDFSDADRADDDDLNDILWRAIKKTDPPAPTRSAFTQ